MSGSGRSIKFRPEIEGLRGFLVLLVILYHTGFAYFEGTYFSVDIFFLLSGYLMARIIRADLARSRFSILGFYEKRARRIFPALLFYVFVALALGAFIVPAHQYDRMADSGLWSLFLAGNFYFITANNSYFSPDMALQPFMHLWSLGLEQQFYLLVPLVFATLIAIGRPAWASLVFAVALLLSFAFAISMVELYSQLAFYHFGTRLWEFALGSLLALNETRVRSWVPERFHSVVADLGCVVAFVVFVIGSPHWRHPGYPTLVPLLGASLFICLAKKESIAFRMLSSRPLIFLGGLSFSLYLSHQMLFAFARWYSINSLTWGMYLGLTLLATLLSWCTFQWVEQPFRDRRQVAPLAFWSWMLISILALSSVTLAISKEHGVPQRFTQSIANVYSKNHGYSHRAETMGGVNCYVESAGGRPCPIGEAGAARNWLLVGDSHAGAILSALDEAMHERGLGGYAIVMGACAYAQGSQPVGVIGKPCRRRNDWVREFIATNEDIHGVILVSRYHYYLYKGGYDNGEGGREVGTQWWNEVSADGLIGHDDSYGALVDSFINPIHELLNSGKMVVLTYPIPEMGWNVPNYYYKFLLRGRQLDDISVDYERFFRRVAPIVSAFDDLGVRDNLYRVDPARIFCDLGNSRCSAMKDGKLLFWDDDHLNPVGARLLVEHIVEGMGSLTDRIVTRF